MFHPTGAEICLLGEVVGGLLIHEVCAHRPDLKRTGSDEIGHRFPDRIGERRSRAESDCP
jgi:hypothetical protein